MERTMRGYYLITLALQCSTWFVAATVLPSARMSATYSSDFSKPTMGLQGESTSNVNYNTQDGVKFNGQIGELLGPPIKIANGLNNIVKGGEMASLGSGIKGTSALLGIDAKILETMGGAHLLKGGAMFGGAMAKTAAAKAVAGKPGKMLSSIVELPIKVVALKEMGIGKHLAEAGKFEGAIAAAGKAKGVAMIAGGEAKKANGINQVLDGATEGLTNIGNAVQKTTNNAATALRFLPLIMNQAMPPASSSQQEPITQQAITNQSGDTKSSTGTHKTNGFGGSNNGGAGSLFGGLLPGLDLGGMTGGNSGIYQLHNAPYAAAIDANSPFANILTNPALNPLLLPMNTFQSNIYNRQSANVAPSKLNRQQPIVQQQEQQTTI